MHSSEFIWQNQILDKKKTACGLSDSPICDVKADNNLFNYPCVRAYVLDTFMLLDSLMENSDQHIVSDHTHHIHHHRSKTRCQAASYPWPIVGPSWVKSPFLAPHLRILIVRVTNCC